MQIFVAFWEWVKLMGSDWVGRISGGGSVAAAFAALYFKFVADNPKPALWAVAVACFFVASFWVWYERWPNLIIDVTEIYWDARGHVTVEGIWVSDFLTIALHMTNTREADNAIKGYDLVVRSEKKKWLIGHSESVLDLILRKTHENRIALEDGKNSVLMRGRPCQGWVRFRIGDLEPIPAGESRNLDNLAGRSFVLTITDVYKRKYKLKGKVPSDLSHELFVWREPSLSGNVRLEGYIEGVEIMRDGDGCKINVATEFRNDTSKETALRGFFLHVIHKNRYFMGTNPETTPIQSGHNLMGDVGTVLRKDQTLKGTVSFVFPGIQLSQDSPPVIVKLLIIDGDDRYHELPYNGPGALSLRG